MRLISIDVLAAACPALSVADQCQFGGEGLFDQTEARIVTSPDLHRLTVQ
jgi:hypothetical protein